MRAHMPSWTGLFFVTLDGIVNLQQSFSFMLFFAGLNLDYSILTQRNMNGLHMKRYKHSYYKYFTLFT